MRHHRSVAQSGQSSRFLPDHAWVQIPPGLPTWIRSSEAEQSAFNRSVEISKFSGSTKEERKHTMRMDVQLKRS